MNATILLFAAAWTAFQIDPFYTKPHPRDAAPEDGRETTALVANAAIGEIEAVSFMLRPERDLRKLDLVPGDLKGPGGATIPAAAVDVRTVKYWWQDRIRWVDYYNWEKYAKKNAVYPDILLHDDALVKVDEVGTNNYVRAEYPDGTRYVCVSEDTPGDWNEDLEPVRDAKRFVPFDVEKGRYRQYWLTLAVPADAKPGAYAGTVRLVSDGADVGTLALNLTVYPFALPTPRTRLDPDKVYHAWIMCHNSIGYHLANGKDLAHAEAKTLACYRNLKAHNCIPSGVGAIAEDSPDDLTLRGLALMQQAGFELKPISVDGGHDGQWLGFLREMGEKRHVTVTPQTHPKEFAEAQARFTAKVERDMALFKKYAGHTDLIYSAIDEGSTALNRLQFPFWDILHAHGCRVFATAGDPAGAGHQIDMNDILSTISVRVATQWHVAGGEAYTYAAQFFGAIQPDHYRRDKGLRFWCVNYEGANEYIWYEGVRWNDFLMNTDNYGTFGVVFPTQDGILDTCAWEAYREGLDDIRYLSLLNLRASEAVKSADKAVAKRGKEQLAWLLSVDSEHDTDLAALRAEVARRIVTLPVSKGESAAPFKSPEIRLAPASKGGKVADADALAESDRWRAKNRYDEALKYARQALAQSDLDNDAYDKVLLKTVPLLMTLRRREEAAKLLAVAEERAPVTAAHRAKMQLEQASILLTTCNYAEALPAANVDRAAKLLAAARTVPGNTARKRDIFHQILGAYQRTGQPKKVLALTEEPLREKGATNAELAPLRDARIRAAGALGDYDRVLKEFRAYEKLNLGKWSQRRAILEYVGALAAARDDAATASRCYTDVYSFFDPKSENDKYERGRVQRLMTYWSNRCRKTQKFDGSTEEEGMSLDED